MGEYYRLHFGGPVEWERVEESDGVTSSTLHLSEEARRALTVSDRAACATFGHEDPVTVAGTRARVCLRCGAQV